jgi:HD-like signal output (HDOD) protein
VLRVANSALFSGTRECIDVKHAVIRLGAEEVKNILIGVAVMGMFDDNQARQSTLREFSRRLH